MAIIQLSEGVCVGSFFPLQRFDLPPRRPHFRLSCISSGRCYLERDSSSGRWVPGRLLESAWEKKKAETLSGRAFEEGKRKGRR